MTCSVQDSCAHESERKDVSGCSVVRRDPPTHSGVQKGIEDDPQLTEIVCETAFRIGLDWIAEQLIWVL